MKKEIKELIKVLGIILGVLFIFVGIAGLFVPIMPGWVFIVIGLVLLGYQPVSWLVKNRKKKR